MTEFVKKERRDEIRMSRSPEGELEIDVFDRTCNQRMVHYPGTVAECLIRSPVFAKMNTTATSYFVNKADFQTLTLAAATANISVKALRDQIDPLMNKLDVAPSLPGKRHALDLVWSHVSFMFSKRTMRTHHALLRLAQ